MNEKVIVAGHICLDITPIFPEKKVSQIAELLLPGKLIQMKEADVHTGGAVANTGLAMKMLGADVSLIGKVGMDAFGDMLCSILNRYEAGGQMIRSDGVSTSYSVVLAIPGNDRIFLHNPGANHFFCAADISEEQLEQATLLHFGYPPLMQSMYVNRGEELVRLFRKAKKAGCATSLDMAAVDADSEAGSVDWNLILQRLLPYVDFFVPSVEELSYMLSPARFQGLQDRAHGKDITEILDMEQDVKPLADTCIRYGAKVVLIKCGVPGIYYCSAEEKRFIDVGSRVDIDLNNWAGKRGFECSYVPERILSATGAGDTSIAAFLTSMLRGYSLEECMHFATAMGASCVASYDALSGLRTLEELQEMLTSGWAKQKREGK